MLIINRIVLLLFFVVFCSYLRRGLKKAPFGVKGASSSYTRVLYIMNVRTHACARYSAFGALGAFGAFGASAAGASGAAGAAGAGAGAAGASSPRIFPVVSCL